MSDLANAPDDDIVFTSRPPGVGGAAIETGTSLVSRSSYFRFAEFNIFHYHTSWKGSWQKTKKQVFIRGAACTKFYNIILIFVPLVI